MDSETLLPELVSEIKPAAALEASPAPGTALTIDCAQEVIEQIRAAALAGLRQLSRGGLEVGGLLLGEHIAAERANAIRILSWRPILCEHARGPAFLLIDKDRAELADLLRSLAGESAGTGSQPLGWFVSHTKGAAALTDSDHEIYRQFFPEAWQTTLVLNPGRDGNAEASFFIRDVHGRIGRVGQPKFSISPARQSAPGARGAAAPEQHLKSRRVAGRRAWFERRGWIWLVPVLLALIVLGTMLDRHTVDQILGWREGVSKPASFGFRASDAGDELRIEWDRNSQAIREAARASLEIKDGTVTVPIALDSGRLREGFFNYTRKSGDLELRMTVYPPSGAPAQEFTKFVGAPGVKRISPEDAAALRRERDTLKADVQQLRESLRKESARNRQLEQTVRILEQRVQVEKLRGPKGAAPSRSRF